MSHPTLKKLHAVSNISSRLAPLAIAVAAALVTQPVFGVPDHQLVFTENSSSSLSVTYDGSGADIGIAGGSDNWAISFLQNIDLAPGGLQWQEPENPYYVNQMVGEGDVALVESDLFGGYYNWPPDGYTHVDAGTDTSDGVPIDVTFHDLGDIVPETGSTFALFLLSFFALMGATRVAPFRQREMVRSCANGEGK